MTSALARPLAAVELSDAQFRRIGELVGRIAGIQLPPGKESLVRSRIAKRLRALSVGSVQLYLDYIDADSTNTELAEMIDVLTTNKTSFFREAEHFRLLEREVFPSLARRPGPITLWSAGCSTGEEAYTLAMVARDTLGATAANARILATDISSRVLARARAAEYSVAGLEDVPQPLRARHFEPAGDGTMRVGRATRDLVQVARLNLMGGWPMRGPFDVIFCRNVMIYFDKPTQSRLVARFAELLSPGGYLCVGHSESLSGLHHGLDYVQPATYRR